MLVASLLKWWYGAGWLAVATSFNSRARNLNSSFSTGSLIKTLFSPWRRIISYPGAGLDAKIHAAIDNLFSRVVGFVVRLFVLLAAGISLIIIMVLTTVEVLAWPLLPLGVIIFIVLAVRG